MRNPNSPTSCVALAIAVVALGLPRLAITQSALQTTRSQSGAVASGHPLATEAGVRMLELGGNAADAAVATGFAIAVVEPTMNSIGGRNQILIRLPDGTVRGIDGTTQAPPKYDPETAPQAAYGYNVIAVPGAVAGLLRLHKEHGSLPLATVMAPAIDYAENGYRLLPGEAGRQAGNARQSAEFPATAAIYLKPDGTPRRAGDMLVQKDYANTLRAIALGGAEEFYRGKIAQAMAADLAAHNTSVDMAAIADYRAVDARIVRSTYRGYEVIGMDVPTAGSVVLQALNVMERFDPKSMTAAQWAAVEGQALGIASRELRVLGSDTAAARATSKEWAGQIAPTIRTPTQMPKEGGPSLPALDPIFDHEGHTTHLTAADTSGMFVALTQTLGPNMGSSVVTPGLGFLYASTLGGYLGSMKPGERARSFISPMMVLKDGVPVLALGAAGGARIVSGVLEVISRVIDGGMSLSDALAAPRVHMNTNGTLDLETTPGIGWTPAEVEQIKALGIKVTETPGVGSFSRVHAIQFDAASKTWIGGADPDWEGSAQSPPPRRRGRGGEPPPRH